MRLHTMILFATAALVLPIATRAESLSYRYVDVAHFPEAEIDRGNVDADGDGVQLRGSLPVYRNFFVFTEFQDLDFDFDVDVTRLAVGAGGHWPINDKVDIIARGGVVNYQVDVGRLDDDDTGIFIGGRVRAIVIPNLELEGGIEHQQVDAVASDSDTYLVGEARYHFTPQWSAGVILNLGGDANLIGVQGRVSF